ncbi:hypothetical protein [Tardiphaga robiniae]|jgi:hypothetical protein|uniref:Uncharacterized protein n=2 Tax=Tardiphaga robiniae TaxID=943830 RepID=A0A7G6U161_9BRAD|nr:hypothetical protein [Tardiphaga robiniae]QND72743.1 hypothetical protein HB776_16995 [Tardiphaga robiniae]
MSYDPARNIVDGLLKLGALSVQIGVLMAEALLAAGGSTKTLPADDVPDPPPSPAQIEAIALALEREILGNYELGFQAMLRLNFPRDRLREIAVTALNAARGAGRTTTGATAGNDAE